MITRERGESQEPARDQEASRSREPKLPVLSVIIPALNEQDSIADIVHRVKTVEEALRSLGIGGLEIIVVDDGSRDKTAEIAARLPAVRLLRHSTTRGYGAAIKTGFCHARGSLLAFLDADGTYPPEHLPALCMAAVEQGADVAVGSRRSGAESQMPILRRIGNFLWSHLVSLIGQRRCVDPASGMRVLRRSALPRLYPLPDGLNFTPVMSTRALHEGLKVIELPIPYHERQGRSKLSIVRDGTRFLKTILWTAFEYNPVKVFGLIGLILFALAGSAGVGLVLMRIQGVTTLGTWGVFSVFVTLVLSVAGVSIYSLGVTFNFLVALFHRQPLRQGIFGNPVFDRSLQPHFGWIGTSAIAGGTAMAVTSMILGVKGWEIARVWFWLLGSALFILVGLQLLISWIVARVLEGLSEREARIDQEMRSDLIPPCTEEIVNLTNGRAHEVTVHGCHS